MTNALCARLPIRMRRSFQAWGMKPISPCAILPPISAPAISASAAIIRNAEGHVLLQRRSDNGLWGLPGGSVEIGESVTTAVVREVKEE